MKAKNRFTYYLSVIGFVILFVSNSFADIYESEPNGSMEEADVIISETSVFGHCSSEKDADVFRITTTEPDNLKREFSVHFDVDWIYRYIWQITVKDESGKIIAHSAKEYRYSHNDSILYVGLEKTGTYYIEISSTQDDNYSFVATVEKGEISGNTDSDGDGVIDGWDDCPGTPEESYVDKNGCAGQAGSSGAELDEKYREGYQAGLALCENGASPTVASDNCATYAFVTNTRHIPCFTGGEAPTYWLDFNIISNAPVQLELENTGMN